MLSVRVFQCFNDPADACGVNVHGQGAVCTDDELFCTSLTDKAAGFRLDGFPGAGVKELARTVVEAAQQYTAGEFLPVQRAADSLVRLHSLNGSRNEKGKGAWQNDCCPLRG